MPDRRGSQSWAAPRRSPSTDGLFTAGARGRPYGKKEDPRGSGPGAFRGSDHRQLYGSDGGHLLAGYNHRCTARFVQRNGRIRTLGAAHHSGNPAPKLGTGSSLLRVSRQGPSAVGEHYYGPYPTAHPMYRVAGWLKALPRDLGPETGAAERYEAVQGGTRCWPARPRLDSSKEGCLTPRHGSGTCVGA